MDGPVYDIFPRGEASSGLAERGKRALVVTVVLTSLGAFMVGLRFFTRVGLVKLTGREDWMILGSLTLSITYMGFVIAQVQNGLGKHNSEVPEETLEYQLKMLWLAIPFYNMSLGCTKSSILFNLLRVFPNRGLRIACYVVLGVVATYTVWASLSAFLNCIPVQKFWEPETPGYCLNFEALWFFNASVNMVTDLTILILPMPVLSHLQLPKKQKIAIMAVFAVGGVVCLTSILRLASLKEVATSTDTSYDNVGAAYWTAAEINVGIMCACLPYMRPLIARIFPHFISTNSYHHSYGRKTEGHIEGTRTHRTTNRGTMISVNRDYDMYSINIQPGENHSRSTMSGIEVTTEVAQETKPGDTISERRLVLDP